MAELAADAPEATGEDGTRRDFLYLLTGATAAVGAAVAVWPLINAMNPSADVLALASTEVDLSGVEEGMSITVKWRSKPVFIREGGSIPVVTTFRDLLGVDTLLLGWGQNTDNLHSPNEKFSLIDFHRGTRASAYLWQELAGQSG